MNQMQREESLSSWSSSSAWSELPKDLVIMISELLDEKLYADYVRFSSVCKSWNSFLTNKPYHPTHQFPVLISSYRGRNRNGNDQDHLYQRRYGIFGLANNNRKLHHLRHLRDLPDEQFVLVNNLNNRKLRDHFRDRRSRFLKDDRPCYSAIKGSSDGWLVISGLCIHSEQSNLYLYNPFTNAKLCLPPIEPHYIKKVVLSSTPPAPAAVLLVALCNMRLTEHRYPSLVYTKLGDKAWTDLKPSYKKEDEEEDEEILDFKDVLFHGNTIYALHHNLDVSVFQINDGLQVDPCCSVLKPQPELRQYQTDKARMPSRFSACLVGSSSSSSSSNDDVLMVVQRIKRELVQIHYEVKDQYFTSPEIRRKTIGFIVFKWESESERWKLVKSLGEDQMLFIGPFSSFSISSKNHDFPGFRGNCICFIDFYWRGQPNINEIGIFSLEDDSIFSIEDDHVRECSSSSLAIQDDTFPRATPSIWRPAWLIYNYPPGPPTN